MRDIESRADLRKLVERFYTSVRADADLGPIFASRIRDDDWSEHLDTMTRFWSSIVLASTEYHGNPLVAHRGLPVDTQHFERWLELWQATTVELFDGPIARGIVARAHRIAGVLARRLEEVV
jgi:hemoglobin